MELYVVILSNYDSKDYFILSINNYPVMVIVLQCSRAWLLGCDDPLPIPSKWISLAERCVYVWMCLYTCMCTLC